MSNGASMPAMAKPYQPISGKAATMSRILARDMARDAITWP